jgi:hypothetical protein
MEESTKLYCLTLTGKENTIPLLVTEEIYDWINSKPLNYQDDLNKSIVDAKGLNLANKKIDEKIVKFTSITAFIEFIKEHKISDIDVWEKMYTSIDFG